LLAISTVHAIKSTVKAALCRPFSVKVGQMNLTLRHKILLGYIVMISFTIVVAAYAIWSLIEINKITSEIIYADGAAAEKMSKLNDALLAQDLFEKRFLTLRQTDAENSFWERSREFTSLLAEIVASEAAFKNAVDDIRSSHGSYNLLFLKEASLVKAGNTNEAEDISSGTLAAGFNKVMTGLKDLDLQIKTRKNAHISASNSLGVKALTITIVLGSFSLVFGILFASLITHYLTTTIESLKAATNSIRSGDYDNLPEIKGADELTDLAISFKEMSVRLKELEEMNLDANPLTKLPGNLAIEKELLTRLNETQKFSFCLADLDNFKAFNDRYGYARGSDVIKWMGDMLLKLKKEVGAPEDFIGHIGGDDFVIICSPERVNQFCTRIIQEFDNGITAFYDLEDAKKGFITSLDRNDNPAVFGILTISIAVVNTDRTLIREPKEVAMKVTELKQYAKTFAKSLYIMDRRRSR
jgi:GGDEF domain-containing protein/CHASE3 domain sensor protein